MFARSLFSLVSVISGLSLFNNGRDLVLPMRASNVSGGAFSHTTRVLVNKRCAVCGKQNAPPPVAMI